MKKIARHSAACICLTNGTGAPMARAVAEVWLIWPSPLKKAVSPTPTFSTQRPVRARPGVRQMRPPSFKRPRFPADVIRLPCDSMPASPSASAPSANGDEGRLRGPDARVLRKQRRRICLRFRTGRGNVGVTFRETANRQSAADGVADRESDKPMSDTGSSHPKSVLQFGCLHSGAVWRYPNLSCIIHAHR